MISLTPEQREYKKATLNQLIINQTMLEDSLENETRPEVVRSIQSQLQDIDAHINRLQDELSGDVIFDEPVADDLFKQAAQALAKNKFFLAKKHIHRLETIEPFYPGIDRMRQEAESGRVSRRTRSIAQGLATRYPGTPAPPPNVPNQPVPAVAQPEAAAPRARNEETEPQGWFSYLFQFHIIISCLLVIVLVCAVFGVTGVSVLGWLVQGG